MYVCVYLLQPLIRSREQWEITNKPHHFPYTPQGFFSFCISFPPSNYSDDIAQISSWEHSSQHHGQTQRKTFAGSGATAMRQVPPRTGKVLSQPGGQNTWDVGNVLCSLQLQDSLNMLLFGFLFFVDHNLIIAWNSEHLWRARAQGRHSGWKVYQSKGINQEKSSWGT